MDELGQSSRRRLRTTAGQPGQTRQCRVRFVEADIRNLGAVASVPAKPRPPEPSRVVDQEQDELERVRQADEVQLGRRCKRDSGVAGVEGAAEAGVG